MEDNEIRNMLRRIDQGEYIDDDVLEGLGGYVSDARFSRAMDNKREYIANLIKLRDFGTIYGIENYDLHLPDGFVMPYRDELDEERDNIND